jgi:hypothetical protein
MPDESPAGKRLHLERMAALGLEAAEGETLQPVGSHLDAARRLVDKVVVGYTQAGRAAAARLALGYAALALVVGIVAGYVLGRLG